MQRPNAAQLTGGSAAVVLATVALLLLSGATTAPGVTAVCVAALLLGVLVAVTMPSRAGSVKTSAPTPPGSPAPPLPPVAGNEEIRVPARRVSAGAETRIGS